MIQNLTTDQRKKIAAQKLTMVVNPYEAIVILELRKHVFADVVVSIMDSVPFRCKQTISTMMEQSEQFEEIIAKAIKESGKDKNGQL